MGIWQRRPVSLTGKNIYQLNYSSFLMPQIEEIRCIFLVKSRESKMSREPTGQLIELRATIMEISLNKMKLWIRRGNVCFALDQIFTFKI